MARNQGHEKNVLYVEDNTSVREVYTEKLRVTWQQRRVQLSLCQVRMIHAMVERPGQVTSLAKLTHNAAIVVEPNTITAHIRAIRNALKSIDPEFANITSVRSVGYRWTD